MTLYDQYLHQERSNNKNTRIKSLTFVRTFINKAILTGDLSENPIKQFKIGRIEGNREYLNSVEVDKLEQLLQSNKLKQNKANVLRYFLFSCYTGQRYSDIQKLKFSDITNELISIRMTKTQDFVKIPIIPKAIKLLPKTNSFEKQKVFKVLSDQATNRYLKDIMLQAGINKTISFHCARHTFATLGLEVGIPVDVVSKLLGHTDLKTTQIYAKYGDKLKIKEMRKWNNSE